ncbi:MAG: pilus assembly protein PilM [Planctomycetota bacterium]|jgi:type IV pilus assembly protein PilM
MANPIYTGIDIGQQTIKIASLRRNGTMYEVLGAGVAHIPEVSPEETGSLNEITSNILLNIIKTQKIPVGHTIAGLGGRGSLIRYLPVPIVPPWKLSMLMAFEIEEHRASSGEIAFDYQILDLPEFEEGQFSVLLAQAQESAVNNLLEICRKSVRRANEIDIASLGVHNLYNISADYNEEEITLCLDIGLKETSVSMQQGNALFFCRSISHGAEKFSSSISRTLGISLEAAEEIKELKGCIIKEGDEGTISDEKVVEVSEACRAEATSLASAVQSSIVFFRNQLLRSSASRAAIRLPEAKEKIFQPDKLFITGQGAGLTGLEDFLAEKMNIPCSQLDLSVLCENLSGSAELSITSENIASFSTALGLAAGRARANGASLNLITPSEKARRKFREQTVFAIAAGIIGFLIIVLSVFSSYRELSREKKIAKVWKKGVKSAKEKMTAFNKLKAENERLNTMVGALHKRTHSPLDMLKVLSTLRKINRPDIFFSKISAEIPFESAIAPGKEAAERIERRRGRRDRNESSKEEPGSSQNKNTSNTVKKFILEGYCFDKDKAEASKKITKFAESLENHKSRLFRAVVQEYGRWIDEENKLDGFFTVKGKRVKKKTNQGSAFLFRLECVVGGSY